MSEARMMMPQDDAQIAIGTRQRLIRRAVLVGAAAALCFASFAIGRLVERRAAQSVPAQDTVSAPAKTPENPGVSSDDQALEEITDLLGQVSEMNWELVPYKEFEAGKIDAATLRQRTAEPEIKILRMCTQMYKRANDLENTKTRHQMLNLAGAFLQRQRRFAMIIEGLSLDEESRVTEGAKLFEDGRNKSLAALLEFGGSDNAHAKRLLDAYEPGRK